jgi:transcriptional regulator with XRE-family HTH domain
VKSSTVRRTRERLGMSQSRFAELIGVSPNTVARWERGELGMRPTTARLITLIVGGKRIAKATQRRSG